MDLFQFSIWWFLCYIGLNATLIYMLNCYFKDNVSPPPWTSLLVVAFLYPTIKLYPNYQKGSADLLMFFGTYAVVTLIPFSQMAVLTTKIIADILINNDDFNPSNLKNYLSEIKIPLDTYLSTGKYQEAIEFLKEQQKLKRYAKDYRICIEIATIAMSNLNDLKLAMSEYSRVLVITKKPEALAYSLFRMADIYALKEETRDKARECLVRLIQDFHKTEYGKNAELKLHFMDMQDKGLIDEHEFEITESDPSKPDMIQTDESGNQLVFGADTGQLAFGTETSSLINASPGAYEQAVAIAKEGATEEQKDSGAKEYQALLQRSIEKGGKKDQKLASNLAREKVSSLLMPMKNMKSDKDSLLLKRSQTFSRDSYQSLLNSSMEKNAAKKQQTGGTGLLREAKKRSGTLSGTGSLRLSPSSRLGASRPPVMSDSEAYQMMLSRQGVKLLDQKSDPSKQNNKVNVREDGLTGFTRLNRMRRPKE